MTCQNNRSRYYAGMCLNSNNHPVKTVFIFVDGLGLGKRDAAVNPIYSGICPTLRSLLENNSVSLDACLGVDGIPQSATGQTALLTGQNAPRMLGRHIEGFPNADLRNIIQQDNIFIQLKKRGYACSFANAYYLDSLEQIPRPFKYSVTTVTTLSGVGQVRMKDRLADNEAVYHDLTREALRQRGYQGPLITPEQAADHLMTIAEKEDFTLFEFFQTDLQAHRGSDEEIKEILSKLDMFLQKMQKWVEQPGHLLVLSSDHGNIEDNTHRAHSLNPVPFIALGYKADRLKENVQKLTDVVPCLLELYPAEKGKTR
jgi:hypothetical protein